MKDTPQPFIVLATIASGPWAGRERRTDAVYIVTVNFDRRHSEGAKLVRKRAEVGDLPGGTEALHAVQIDNEREVIEFLMGQKYERFPARAFIPFTIRCQAKDSAALLRAVSCPAPVLQRD